ncbi:MAG: hypothetical protein IJ747_02695 [Lachnospiraceae bacterium]|nr:hypothetical protein [Lachnospiraceae bacterium]
MKDTKTFTVKKFNRCSRIASCCFLMVWVAFLAYMRTLRLGSVVIAVPVGVLWVALQYLPESRWQGLRRLNARIWNAVDGVFSERELFWNVWVVGFLIFFMAYLAYFPGIFGYDAAAQFAMYMGKIDFHSAKQPLFHTLTIGVVLSAGKAVLGSYSAGLAAYVAVQGALITNCVAHNVIFLKRHRCFLPAVAAGLLWLVCNPYIQILNCNITKDVLFGVFFLEFVISFIYALEHEKNSFGDVARMTGTGILLCLFRNGFVLPFIVLAAVCFALRIRKKEIFLSFAIILVVVEGFSTTADLAFGIKKGPVREYMSVPIQQMAEVLYLEESGMADVVLSDVQRQELLELLPDEEELLYGFRQGNADAPKAIFREEKLKGNLARYIQLYLSVGSKNGNLYRDAWIYMMHPYFAMNDNEDRALMLYDFLSIYFAEDEVQIDTAPHWLLFYRHYLDNAARGEVRWLHEPGIAFLLLGILTARMIAERKRSILLGLVFVLFYFSGILLAPVALMRYTYPLMLAVPLFAGLSCATAPLDHEEPHS